MSGTFVGVRFHASTNKALHNLAVHLGVPNSVRPDRFHSTVLMSSDDMPEFTPWGEIYPTLKGIPRWLDLWTGIDSATCLVMGFDCPDLVVRHERLVQLHAVRHTHEEYIPHITLSYDVGDSFSLCGLYSYVHTLPELIIVQEYSEPLNEIVANTNKTKGN